MRLAMIGTGYVGLVSGTCFSEFGWDVVCVDRDAAKIESLKAGKIPIFEPGLDRMVESNRKAGRLTFTTDLAGAVAQADAVFIAVGTPTQPDDGSTDLSAVKQVAEEVAGALQGYSVVVTKSTVPVGTGARVAGIIAAANPGADFDVVSNPEFLREGAAINDFLRPDRVVIGTESQRARAVMRELYRPLFLIETPILFTSVETAELIKYAANAFLATKITFINEMADLCEKVGADVHHVAKAMGLDGRIGSKFLHPGPGFGGSCFPKDTRSLVFEAARAGSPTRIVESVVAVNDARKKSMADRILTHCGGSLQGKIVAVLGLTFKPSTDDMREAPSLDIVPALQSMGAAVRAFDPAGMAEAKKLLSDIIWCENAYQTAEGADVLVLITEWNAFRALNLARIKDMMKEPSIVDLRNIYNPDEMLAAGFHYTCVGRGVLPEGNTA